MRRPFARIAGKLIKSVGEWYSGQSGRMPAAFSGER